MESAFARFSNGSKSAALIIDREHITDAKSTISLLNSIEYAETEMIVQEWAQEDKDKLNAAKFILSFIKYPEKGLLRLGNFNLSSLPDIFMNSVIRENLKYILLHNNNLSDLPSSFQFLSNLIVLDLCGNQFVHLPDFIGNFHSLKKLNLDSNPSLSLPDSLENLEHLEELDLAHTQMTELPTIIYKLESLTRLNLSFSNIRELSEEIEGLKNLLSITLTNTLITRLPISIGNISTLYSIILSNSQVEFLPENLENLRNLTCLDLTGTSQLRGLPSTITNLSRSCIIMLERSGISDEVLDRLSATTRVWGYAGPQIHFSIREVNNVDPRTINEILDQFCQTLERESLTLEKNYPNLHEYTKQPFNYQTLRLWLSRLSFMNLGGRLGSKQIAEKILSYLEMAEKSEEFRHVFHAEILCATESCGDRVIYSLLKVGLANRALEINKKDLKSYADFLIHGPWMIEQLEEVARNKVQTMHFVDEIELYLAYPVQLRERLNIQIDVDDMLYFKCSNVTQEDLLFAENLIRDQITDPLNFARILSKREKWIEVLKETFPKEMQDFESKKLTDYENGIEEEEYDEKALLDKVSEEYDQKVLDLTLSILKK